MPDAAGASGDGEDERAPAASYPLKMTVILIVAQLVMWGVAVGLSVLGKGRDDPFIPGLTIMQSVAILSFLVNFAVYVPAFIWQTEKYYDITGTATYVSCVTYSLAAGWESAGSVRARSLVASALVFVWTIRLGTFLFARIKRDGKDGRFDALKPSPLRFFNAWNLQGLWVFLTAYAVYVANASTDEADLNAVDAVGIAIWVIGFAIEAVADGQKSTWRAKPENRGKFIEYGLWYYSRHPNYFGEITLWTGMFVLCASSLDGTQWAAVLSPIFVFCLLNFLSGVPMVERRADEKWGGQPDYENYKATTSVLVILPKLGKRVHTAEETPILNS